MKTSEEIGGRDPLMGLEGVLKRRDWQAGGVCRYDDEGSVSAKLKDEEVGWKGGNSTAPRRG